MSPQADLRSYELVSELPRRRRRLGRLWAWARIGALGLAAVALFCLTRGGLH